MDKVKAKIVELCPDVMELKSGCEIEYDGETAYLTGETYTMGDAFGSVPARKFWVTNKGIKGIDSFHENGKEWKILGSPITLAVVLRAIRNAGHGIYGKGSSGGDDKGNWFFINDSKHAWNLEHDNYDQQSEECKQFIGSLLGV